jgi:SAM-dependent methyltransferase
MTTRWETETPDDHSHTYVAHIRGMAAQGRDLGGEARLLDAIVAPGSHVLDAGCGLGRVGAVLHERGHRVVGVDVDPVLIDAAREDHPGPTWIVGDLASLDLAGHGVDEPFDGAAVAGNVMVYVGEGTERAVLERLAAHLRPDAPAVFGFAIDRHYTVDAFDADAQASGFDVEHRFATWDLRPWRDGDGWAVTILRRA